MHTNFIAMKDIIKIFLALTYITQRSFSFSSDVCLRFTNWHTLPRLRCTTEIHRGVCVLSLANIEKAMDSGCLSAHKFSSNLDPGAAACWFQHINKRDKDQFLRSHSTKATPSHSSRLDSNSTESNEYKR